MVVPLMGSGELPGPVAGKEGSADATRQREELVRRVVTSSSFEKSPRLRAFFLYVCRCALENKPEEATEQQIGIHVYDRPADYNPNEDNVVRAAARSLRIKLAHHFANEGKDEPIVITIPKGRYLPVFGPRTEAPTTDFTFHAAENGRTPFSRKILAGASVLIVLLVMWLAYLWISSRSTSAKSRPYAVASGSGSQAQDDITDASWTGPVTPGTDEVRIVAGRSESYLDKHGRRWEADRYFEGGVSLPGPAHLFPPVVDPGMFKTMREASSPDPMIPQWFRYDIPLHPGAYELRLYFADPLRQPEAEIQEDGQNRRHFQINLNGRPLLMHFDAVADGGTAAVSVRVFKDVAPAGDGELHLEFSGGQRPFVNAIEVTPGTPGKLKPIRIAAAQTSDAVGEDGTRWSGDDYFVGGRTLMYKEPETGPKIPAAYTGERYGNFSYAIPVAPGSYTVRLHFLESFFSPVAAAQCRGIGCRIFDVSCNGIELLKEFDIVQAASGDFQPVMKEFHGLRPNGQGKLLLSFSPKVNYAEVRAIEVIDEAK